MNLRILILASLFFSCLSLPAQDTLKTFIFGHSLINHELQVNPTPSQETSVPHWFHFLAEEAGYNYAVSGQYGFLPQHANLPPIANWGFDFVSPAWDSDNEPFAAADFDNILITPGNFIQWQGPAVPYFNDSLSPLDYTNRVFNWVNQEEDSLTLYIYENWPDMAPFLANGFPPTPSEWTAYNNDLQGGFHDWFLEYHDSLMLAHPNHCVRMIPVGPVISDLLMTSPFNQIAIDSLYEDDAPHGRATKYFLAALVTYMAMYEEQAPLTYQPPAIIDSTVRNNYQQAVTFIWNELQAFNDGNGKSRVFCSGIASSIGGEIDTRIQVYPNPVHHLLHVQSVETVAYLEVLDLQGRVLIQANELTVYLADLPTGMYLLKIHLGSGEIFSEKILKK
jgi:hypothetical protein